MPHAIYLEAGYYYICVHHTAICVSSYTLLQVAVERHVLVSSLVIHALIPNDAPIVLYVSARVQVGNYKSTNTDTASGTKAQILTSLSALARQQRHIICKMS